MKTVEIVKTANGTYVTRRYSGQNKGREFFYSVIPADLETDGEVFLREQARAKEKYIKDWIGE